MQGEDADDENEWLKDMEHNFAVTMRMLERKFEEEGIDINQILQEEPEDSSWDANVHEMFKDSLCYKLAKNYMKKTSNFLKKFHQDRMALYGQLGMEIDFSEIKDEIETISWYFCLLPTKIWRYFYEKKSLSREKDKELKELMTEDLPKYYSLVTKCINQSLNAWQSLSVKKSDLFKECRLHIKLLEKIKIQFNK